MVEKEKAQTGNQSKNTWKRLSLKTEAENPRRQPSTVEKELYGHRTMVTTVLLQLLLVMVIFSAYHMPSTVLRMFNISILTKSSH